jgi:glycosyltransferase involved in cell wall biosynthesis
MHLGLDLLFLVPGETGGRETYARELLGALREAAPRLRVTTFLNRETAAAGAGWWSERADRAVVLRRVWARRAPAWAFGEVAGVARAAADAGVDVLHSPANFAPWHGPFARVLTLHDVLFREAPEHVAPVLRIGTEALLPRAARRAHRVITVSAASRDAIVAELGVRAERIAVIPNGVTVPEGGDAARGRAFLHADDRPVVLALATNLPHKNLEGLLAGHKLLEDRPLLAIAGHGTETLHGEDVRALGALPPGVLEDLWAAAGAAITTTLSEGFGLPVLEAMARGVPVAASDLPVLREVAGEHAVWLDPRDPASIAAALRAVLSADGAAGRERAARFTWRAAAQHTLETYEAART